MRTVLLASLRRNTRRYVASALAVVIGVGFIVATNGLAGALRTGLTNGLSDPFVAAEHVVRAPEPDEVTALIDAAAERGIDAAPFANAWVPARAGDGSEVNISAGVVADAPALRWQELVSGRLPDQPGETAITEATAEKLSLAVGDTVVIGPGARGIEAQVVGVVDVPGTIGDDAYLMWADLASLESLWTAGVMWNGPVEAAQAAAPDASVVTADAFVDELATQVTQGVDVLAILVSIFAAIALGVAILVITNTFAILFAQRARDFALLRCVGVTRAQLRRSIRLEALVLGIVASLVGVLAGVGLAFALAALVRIWFDDMGLAAFSPVWLVAAATIGVLVTLAAAWLPTRAVTRISPLAALRPDAGVDARSRAGRFRLAVGALAALIGVALLAWVVVLAGGETPQEASVLLVLMFAGGGLGYGGLLLLGPVVVPALVRATGALISRGGSSAVPRLATLNAVRNPRRTATTAASLMVGVTLTTAMLTGLSSLTETMDKEMRASYPIDVVVVADEPGAGVADALLPALEAAEGMSEVTVQEGIRVDVGGAPATVVAATGKETSVHATAEDPLRESQITLSYNTYLELPESAFDGEKGTVRITTATGEHELTFGTSGRYGDGTLIVRPDLLAELSDGAAQPAALWAMVTEGADAADVETAVSRAVSDSGVPVQVSGDYAERASTSTMLDVITGAVVGLLGIGVLIALIGVANTLGLSVLERTRENALLRAIGLTRPQLRRTLALEGVLLAGVAALLGGAVGVGFGWVGVKVLVDGVGLTSTFAVPWLQFAVVVAIAVLSGVLASVVPGRRAGKVVPAQGLALD